MIVEIKQMKFKDSVYLADVSLYDEVSFSDVLVLFGFGFASNPHNASKGFLLEASNGNHILLAVDDFKKQEAKQNEVLMYNDKAMMKLCQDNKISIKNGTTDLKEQMNKLVDLVGNLADAVNQVLSAEVKSTAPGSPVAYTPLAIPNFKSQLDGIKQAIGSLLE